MPATAALLAIVPLAIPILYGDEFRAAIAPALVLLLATLVMGAKDVLGFGAQGLGRPWLASRAEIAGTVISGGMLAILLPTLGINGAAVAMLVSAGVQLLVLRHGLARYQVRDQEPARTPAAGEGEHSPAPDRRRTNEQRSGMVR